MKQTLADPALRAQVVVRLQRLAPDSPRQWGRMTPHQAICHLSDSFRGVMGERPLRFIGNPFTRTVVKWVALNAPMKWPPGVKTLPEVDQEIGGTRPVEFGRDRRELESLVEQFAARSDGQFQAHPIFGRLTTRQWQRWGWRHMDHHLRRFGV